MFININEVIMEFVYFQSLHHELRCKNILYYVLQIVYFNAWSVPSCCINIIV